MLLGLIVFHFVAGLVAIAAGRRLGRRAVGIAVAPSVATLLWLGTHLGDVTDGRPVEERTRWVGDLGLSLDFRLDGMAALMVLIISGIGVCVFAYALRYLPARGDGVGRLVGLLTIFSGAMVGLVCADNLLVLFVFWELTSVTSYLLIGNEHDSARARAAALQALLITGAGGLAMFVGIVLVGQAAGSYDLSAIVASAPRGDAVTVGLVLVLAGAMAKSAQYPFHSWLPGAMVAPTPVSAYLHSATMVTAGVYLVGRLAPAFADVSIWRPIALTVGAVTMVVGGLRALRQHDLKLLLAHGTVSQLGLMFMLMAAGTPEATEAGCVLLVAHAVFKAALFMVVGMIDHETGSRDMRALVGLGRDRRWRTVVVVAVASAGSMAGVPLLFGFVAKEGGLAAFDHGGFGGATALFVVAVAGSMLTVAYSIRFLWGAFTAGATDWAGAPPPVALDHAPSAGFVAPAAVLAFVTVLLGLVPGLADTLVDGATTSLDPRAEHTHLALWHGLNGALVGSLVALASGAALFAARRPVSRLLALGRRVPSGAGTYLSLLRGLNVVADRITRVVQNGSLPFYAGVILFTAAAVPGVALVAGGELTDWPELLDAPAHVPLAVLIVGGGLGAALARRRLVAVLFLSVVGYGMAGLFVVEGAPDLALTQVTVETLSTVVFVLVLRRLPGRFASAVGRAGARRGAEGHSSVGRGFRAVVAASVGVMVFVFALVASANRQAEPVSGEMVARSVPDGGGANVVNVILVDFRGFDTLGEITVVAVAAVGAVALARAGRRRPATPASSAGAS